MNDLINSNEMFSEGKKYLFEATAYAEPVITNGKGSMVWDADGNKYLDLNAGQFCMTFGHSYEPFIECITEQMKKIHHTNTSTITPEVFYAAKKMALITDYKLTKTIFLSTGSEANECAVRFAKFIKKRDGILGFKSGYHGLTLASQGTTMGGLWARPSVPFTFSLTTPDYIHSDKNLSEDSFYAARIEELENMFKENGNKLAAVLVEPVIGVGGMVTIPKKYLTRMRELCDEFDVILIFDECQCGFGRSGEWFAYQKANVIPDILVTAKAMGMGLAVSAVTFSEKYAQMIEGKLTHFSSHQNDPVSSAAVSFVIDEIIKNGLLDSNKEKGNYLLECLCRICDSTKYLINPRGNGLMCAFDIDDSVMDNYKKFSFKFIKAMEKNGVLIQAVRQGRTFRIMPNYYILKDEMDLFENAVLKSLEEIRG